MSISNLGDDIVRRVSSGSEKTNAGPLFESLERDDSEILKEINLLQDEYKKVANKYMQSPFYQNPMTALLQANAMQKIDLLPAKYKEVAQSKLDGGKTPISSLQLALGQQNIDYENNGI